MGYPVSEAEMRWQRRPASIGWWLVALAVIMVVCVAVRAARLQARETRVLHWAYTPAAEGEHAMARGRAAPPEQALRARQPRGHVPPTWQQQRDQTRADLSSLCQKARRLATATKVAPEEGVPEGAFAVRRRVQAAIALAAASETRLQADLARARSLRDVRAARREMAALESGVRRAELHLQASRMMSQASASRAP